jgi:hypothetical protein
MTLTHRQRDTVSALLDLYGDVRKPISYRRVAEILRVAPATAYRMLRLAEAKGYVVAVYAPPPREISAGRSSVLFAPTDLARSHIEALAGSTIADEDWRTVKERVLEALARPGDAAARETLAYLLAGLEMPRTPLGLAGRVIAALMIGIEENCDGLPVGGELVRRIMRRGSRLGLSTLGGALLGLAWAEGHRRALVRLLEPHLERYESALSSLSPEQATDLAGFARQVDRALRVRHGGGSGAG